MSSTELDRTNGWLRRLRGSLLARLYLPVAVILVALIGLQTRFLVQTAQRWFVQSLQRDMHQGIERLEQALVEVQVFGDHDRSTLDERLHEAAQLSEIERAGYVVRLVDVRAAVLAGPPVQEPPVIMLDALGAAPPDIAAITYGGERPGAVRPIRASSSCSHCHALGPTPIAWLWLEAPSQSLAANEARVKLVGLLSTVLVAAAFGATVWLLMFLHVKRPFQQLTRAMNRVKAGDLQARSQVDSEDEIGRLAHDFDLMVEKLEETDRQLRRAHVELMMRAEKMVNVGEMASRIAHEIRNPLAGIEGVLSIFHESLDEDDPEKPIMAEALDQAQRMRDTLSDMLAFARPRPPQLVELDLEEVIEGLVLFCRQDPAHAQHEIWFRPRGNLAKVRADRDQIGQALLNVLLNALQVMEEPGQVLVRTSQSTDETGETHVRVSITDTGPGIPDDILPHIFNAFFTTKTKGTGLGLAICRAAVLQQGGRLWVERTGGLGTEFVLSLPALRPGPGPAAG